MAHICLISRSTPTTNPRLLKEMMALVDEGHVISLIMGRHEGWASRFNDVWNPPKGVKHTSIEYGPGSRSLTRVAQLMKRVTAKSLFRLTRTTSVTVAQYASHDVTPGLIKAARNTPADLYVAHYVAALPAAALAARQHGTLYAYDAEDFHLGDWPEHPTFDDERRLVRSIEGRYLPGCAHITAASPMIADAMATEYGVPLPTVVLNVFPLPHAPSEPTPRGVVEPGPSLYWFSQTIGPNRGLECAVRAIGRASSQPHLYLRGSLVPGFGEVLDRLALTAGAAGRLHFLPPAAPDELERLAAAYDLGFCGEPGLTTNNKIALSNKLFTFLLAGVPPLLSSTPAQARLANESGLKELVYPVGDAEALAALLDRCFTDPVHLAELRSEAWRLGQERYNWERESDMLLDLVRRTLSSR